MTPKVYNIIEMNDLRQAIRGAQNRVKAREWSQDPIVRRAALKAWDDLEKIFKRLGNFQ